LRRYSTANAAAPSSGGVAIAAIASSTAGPAGEASNNGRPEDFERFRVLERIAVPHRDDAAREQLSFERVREGGETGTVATNARDDRRDGGVEDGLWGL
jgi:hypothetical protein